jgi:hypothetical protein
MSVLGFGSALCHVAVSHDLFLMVLLSSRSLGFRRSLDVQHAMDPSRAGRAAADSFRSLDTDIARVCLVLVARWRRLSGQVVGNGGAPPFRWLHGCGGGNGGQLRYCSSAYP